MLSRITEAWRVFGGAILSILLACVLNACTTVGFYQQAASGQNEILTKARTSQQVMADPSVPEKVKTKLALVEDIRKFADKKLGLPADQAFDRYSDLGRKYVTWVVYAAPEFSVQGKEWWYPMVGKLAYRGFFTEKDAQAEAERCRRQGYEVHVGGVEAYSTLGWFRDPVLNTFLARADIDLAELIFHELTHVKIFLPGDTDFNEALATAVAETAVERWLKSRGDSAALARYRTGSAKDREIIRLLLGTRKRLETLYAKTSLGAPAMRLEKMAIYREMGEEYQRIRQRWQGDSRYDRAFAKPWNNARLNTVATYFDLVPGFERLLKKHHGNLDAFFADIEKLRPLPKEARRLILSKGSKGE